MEVLKLDPNDVDKTAYLDLKYDGPSFHGVMDIHALGEELLSLERCLRIAFKQQRKYHSEWKDLADDDLLILVEPFQNNCFRKKIKTIIRWVEKHPATAQVSATILIAAVAGSYMVIKDLTAPDAANLCATGNFPPHFFQNIEDRAVRELLSNPKYRKEMASVAAPLSDSEDFVEMRGTGIDSGDLLVKIDDKNKLKFIGLRTENMPVEEDICVSKAETLVGRINAIDLDATKRQLGFKINDQGEEISCSLGKGLDVHDLTGMVGNWVKIEAIAAYDGRKIQHIEIVSIAETRPPFKNAETISMNL